MPDLSDPVPLLGRTALFGRLPEADRAEIAARIVPVWFEPGTLIFARGDAGQDIHVVESGSVRLSVMTAEGRELSLLHAGPGEVLGEIAVLDGGSRTADARAVGRVRTLKLGRAVLLGLMQSRPALAREAIAFLCARLRATNDVLEGIALYPIEARIARFLISAVRLRGGAPAKDGCVALQLGMSQGDLALLIGASRPKVSAALQALEQSGAISRDGDTTYCDIDALGRIAEAG